jgi:hypothetical protein
MMQAAMLMAIMGTGLSGALAQTSFTPGNLAILVAASATANNTTASVVEINKTTAGQSAIQTISIDGNQIRGSGSATSSLYAGNSNDGSLFCFTGHNSNSTGVNANTLTARAVVVLDNSGTVSLATTYTGSSGKQTRCATSLNNSNWFIGEQGGFYTNSATSASPSGNVRGVKALGGTVYAQTSTSALGTISAPSGGTYTALTWSATPSTTSLQDFYLVSSAGNSTYDVLYLLYAHRPLPGPLPSTRW